MLPQPLSPSEELSLPTNPDGTVTRDAAQRLAVANQRLAVYLARRYRTSGVAWEDLVAEAKVGLVRASTTFEPGRGCRFSTYATAWIRHYLLNAIQWRYRTVRLPRHFFGINPSDQRFCKAFAEDHGREPSLEEAAKGCKISVKRLRKCREAFSQSIRVVPHTMEDLLDESAEAIESRLDWSSLGTALTQLPEREREIVRDRYIQELSLEAIAGRLGLSRERVRQLAERALSDLRAILEGQKPSKRRSAGRPRSVTPKITARRERILMVIRTGTSTSREIITVLSSTDAPNRVREELCAMQTVGLVKRVAWGTYALGPQALGAAHEAASAPSAPAPTAPPA